MAQPPIKSNDVPYVLCAALQPVAQYNALPVFKFKLPKSVVPVIPPAPVDEETLKIIAIVQKRVDAETQKRAEAEALIRAAAWGARTLAEAQERTLAEAQKLAQESQAWKDFLIAENARKRDLEDRQKLLQEAEEEREKLEQATEDAHKLALTDKMFERYPITKPTPVAPVAEVAPVKHVRTRHFNKLM